MIAFVDKYLIWYQTSASLPAGRVGDAEDAAASYVYLMANGYSTGAVITNDGGAILV